MKSGDGGLGSLNQSALPRAMLKYVMNRDSHPFGSPDLAFLIDRAIAARQLGLSEVGNVFVRAAEGLVRAALPGLADDIAKVASRKGAGVEMAQRISERLSPAWAGIVLVIWMLRGARQPAIRTLAMSFSDSPERDMAMRWLCSRLFGSDPGHI